MAHLEVLMVTYNRPVYTARSLDKLLDECSDGTTVWLWHNGDHEDTLSIVRARSTHPRVARFFHSRDNVRLREPTNWLWSESTAPFLGRVDDDCLMPQGWDVQMLDCHAKDPTLGISGAWAYYDEDFMPEPASRKMRTLPGGTRIMLHPWVGGSGHVLKRACVEKVGLIPEGEGFTTWCIDVALQGWQNGWIHPFIHMEHMDDPRSPFTQLRSDEDLARHLPLSAHRLGLTTLQEWTDRMHQSARRLQEGSSDPRHYVGWRGRLHRLRLRIEERLRP